MHSSIFRALTAWARREPCPIPACVLAASSVHRKTPSRNSVLASQACQFGRAGRQPLSCPRDCAEQCMSERDPSPFIRVPNRLRTTPRIFRQTFRVNLCYFPTAAKGDFPILLLTRWCDGYFPPDSVFLLFVACTFHSGLCAVEYRLVVGNRHRPKRGSRRGSDGDRHTDDYRTVPADREHRSRIVRIPEPRRRNVHAVGRKGGVQEVVAFQHRDRHFDQV